MCVFLRDIHLDFKETEIVLKNIFSLGTYWLHLNMNIFPVRVGESLPSELFETAKYDKKS